MWGLRVVTIMGKKRCSSLQSAMDGESPPHGLLEPPYPKVASIIQLFVYLFILRKIRELLTGDMICGGRTRGPLS